MNIEETLKFLEPLYPITGAIHVGVGGPHNLNVYKTLGVEKLLLIEANETRCEIIKKHIPEDKDWKVVNQVVADIEGEAQYYELNNKNESGLIPPEKLKPIWPNIKLVEERTETVTTLDNLVRKYTEEEVRENYNLLVIDCLSSLSILIGAEKLLTRIDVIIYREITQELSNEVSGNLIMEQLYEKLAVKGFLEILNVKSWNALINHRIFLRERFKAIEFPFPILSHDKKGPNGIKEQIKSLQQLVAKLVEEDFSKVSKMESKTIAELGKILELNSELELTLIKNKCEAIIGLMERAQQLNNTIEANEFFKILRTEVNLLSHELSLLQKFQSTEIDASKMGVSNTGQNTTADEILSFSQLGQDLWVLGQFNYKKGGFFVEFGATDGILLSNTYLLESVFKWNGICAEPNPKLFKQLCKNRKCTVSNDCIGPKTGESFNFILADAYGGIERYAFDDVHSEKRQNYKDVNECIMLETISLEDFLRKHKAPKEIDYLSVDTEGSEIDILKNFPFDEWKIKSITVEHNNSSNKSFIKKILESNNYELKEERGVDYFFLLNSWGGQCAK